MLRHPRIQPNIAILLAAGLGTRMGAAGKTLPKPLFPLAGRPLIEHVLQHMRKSGIQRVAVNVHHCAALLTKHLAQWKSPQILISDEQTQLLDTGGGILRALQLLSPQTPPGGASKPDLRARSGGSACFVHNCDAFWLAETTASPHTSKAARHSTPCPDFARLARAWEPRGMDALLLLQPADSNAPADFSMHKSGRLLPPPKTPAGDSAAISRGAAAMTPDAGFRYVGVQLLAPSLFAPTLSAAAPPAAFPIQQFWQQAMQRRRLYGLRADAAGTWLHVGTQAAWQQAQNLLQKTANRV